MKNRILIVDDDRSMVRTLCDIFELRGWEAAAAYSGDEAVQRARSEHFPLVLMDVKMEGMNGVEALKAMKSDHPDVHVVLMTAYSAESLLEEGQREGALRILSKPVDIGMLIGVLEEQSRRQAPVLIVDYDEVFLATLADVLALNGFEAVTAGSIDAALNLIRGAPPVAILLHIPVADRLPESIAQVRSVRPDVAVLMYSGNHSAIESARASVPEEWVRAYLEKPLPVEELTELLHDL